MDNQRLFLVIALVFVLFLIWDAWVREQAVLHAPLTQTDVVTPPGDTTGAPASVPQLNDVPGATPGAAPTAAPEVETAGRIHIRTDLFDAEIDAVGGDLRHVGLLTYPETLAKRDQPFVLLDDSQQNFFIIQSGLIAPEASAPDHYQRYSTEHAEYRLADGQDTLEVPLVWTDDSGLKVTKIYTFQRGSFAIGLTHRVENNGSADWSGSQYRQLQRTPPENTSNLGVYTYTGGVISTPDKKYEKIAFDDIAEQAMNRQINGGWVAMIQHYFLGALIPDQAETNNFYTKSVSSNRYVLGMVGQAQTITSGSSKDFTTRLYIGPKVQDHLEEVAPHLELTVDYGFLTVIAQPLFWLLKHIHGIIGNWGWSIMILTLMIKAVFFKLSETSYRSMANMRRLAPQMQKLKERYGDDRQKMNQAMMEMYKKEKINPLGGCLPIVVQIPVFIALYWMLLESVELRQAPWILWIHDLSTKDPFYVLPLLMGATMFIQQKLNPTPPDPIQAKVMMALPLVFTVFFLWFPSGLVLYWLVNNVLSITQQYVITKRIESGVDLKKA